MQSLTSIDACSNFTALPKITTKPINLDPNSEICLRLIENYLSNEIWTITSNSDKYGFTCISKKTLNLF